MIRVAQVVRPAAGGIRRHVSLLLSHLDPAVFTAALFAPRDFQCDPPPPSLHRDTLDIRASIHPVADLRAILQLSRRLRGSFDLVHAHGMRGALIALAAARLARVPALFTAHNLITPGSVVQRPVLRMLGTVGPAIAVSRAVAATLERAGFPADRVAVIPNGIDIALFDAPDCAESERREILAALVARSTLPGAAALAAWLSDPGNLDRRLDCIAAVARLAPEKGLDVLIDAFARLQLDTPDEGRLMLLIAGSGPEEANLRALAAQSSGIIMAGAVEDVAPLLRSADIVAIPSRAEGQGIVALEAMAARKPVVASRVGGLTETIVEGETGLLVPPDDSAALARAISILLLAPERRIQMGLAGRARVESCYSLNEMIARLSELYQRVAARRSAS